ncbi:MAG: ABC transporter permease subunit [Gemmatimonadetes bacterium]|nr:ABC transporter permease subunit [Gemmatimonadota bacterium]
MNLSNVRKVFQKEIRETLRDRRTLLIMLVLPVFLYPALMVLVQQLVLIGRRSLEEQPVSVSVSGASEPAFAYLAGDSALKVARAAAPDPALLETGGADAVVRFSPADSASQSQAVLVYFDASRDRSRRAREVVTDRLEQWGDSVLANRLRAQGLPRSFATPLAVADTSVASAERLGGYALGRFLPPLLIIMTLLGAFFPAIDLTAGEKERGTLETLLTTPVPAREIVAGKFLTVCATAMTTALLNMVSMLLTFQSGVFQLTHATDLNFSIPLATGGLVILLMLPLAVFFAAIALGIAVRAQSFKEAQNHLTPMQFATIVPMYLPMIPGISLSYPVALVPIGGIAVLFRELMGGSVAAGPAVVAVGAMIVYAVLALRFAAKMFGREEVLFGGASGSKEAAGFGERVKAWRGSVQEVPRPSESLALVGLVGLLYFYLGIRLQITGLEQGLFAAQWLLLGLPAVLFATLGPYRTRATLALRAPAPRSLLAAALIMVGGVPVGWGLGWLQGLFLDIPEDFLKMFQQLLTADTPGRFAWLILLIAITPAICEELVFRGVLLQGLSRELSMQKAVIGSALVFAAFHLSFETVIRFLPTFWLGLLMAYVVWHTRSLFASMLMHFINNATAVVLVTTTGLQAHIFGPTGAPRWIALAISAVCLVSGLYLLPRRRADGFGHDPTPAGAPAAAS